MLKDFIRDDHDHSFSVSSLSVQLYTTPTLAHYLIAKHDAILVIMNTLLSECHRRANKVISRVLVAIELLTALASSAKWP